jgi:hypothetical protein
MFGDGSAAGTAAAVEDVSLADAVVVSAATACTRAEWPVDDEATAGALLAAAADALRELRFPSDELAALVRAEWAVAFFAVDESVAVEDADPLSELADAVLPAPELAPVSA